MSGYALPRALRVSFAGAFHGALLYPIVALAICLLLSFWLPRPRPGPPLQPGPDASAAPAGPSGHPRG